MAWASFLRERLNVLLLVVGLVDAAQGVGGAVAHTGGLQPVADAGDAAVALAHLAVSAEGGRAEGTGHGAAVAADAAGVVVEGQAGGGVLGEAAAGAGGDAGRVGTVHTGGGHVGVPVLSLFVPLLQIKDHPERSLAALGVDVVLIHAGHGACAAGGALVNVQIDDECHDVNSVLPDSR